MEGEGRGGWREKREERKTGEKEQGREKRKVRRTEGKGRWKKRKDGQTQRGEG